MTTLAQDAATDSYLSVEKMIHSICWKFVKRFGSDFDDYASEASQAYMRAYNTYDSEKGIAYTTYVYQCVRNALLDLQRKAKCSRLTYNTEIVEGWEDKRNGTGFDFVATMKELSEDAATVMKLVANTPAEIVEFVRVDSPMKARQVVRSYLKDLGWSAMRIGETFSEVRSILT